jgi:hypothetical protein
MKNHYAEGFWRGKVGEHNPRAGTEGGDVRGSSAEPRL